MSPSQQILCNTSNAYYPPYANNSSVENTSVEELSSSNNSNTTTSKSRSDPAGRWTTEEHQLFLDGLQKFGHSWKNIATMIPNRSVVQIRTHAQKYLIKLKKARAIGLAGDVKMDGKGLPGVKTKDLKHTETNPYSYAKTESLHNFNMMNKKKNNKSNNHTNKHHHENNNNNTNTMSSSKKRPRSMTIVENNNNVSKNTNNTKKNINSSNIQQAKSSRKKQKLTVQQQPSVRQQSPPRKSLLTGAGNISKGPPKELHINTFLAGDFTPVSRSVSPSVVSELTCFTSDSDFEPYSDFDEVEESGPIFELVNYLSKSSPIDNIKHHGVQLDDDIQSIDEIVPDTLVGSTLIYDPVEPVEIWDEYYRNCYI